MLAEKLRAATSAGDPSWNLANATYQGSPLNFLAVGPQGGVFFKPDGLKMYVVGNSTDTVDEYNLSTAWEIGTASYLQNFSVAAQDSTPRTVFFKPDGLKMYVSGGAGNDVNEYNLSTAWDVSTASYLQNFSIAAQGTQPFGIFFKPDGLKMYVVLVGGLLVSEYNLSTAWNISTASHLQSLNVSAQDSNPSGIFFKSDGLKMYIVGSTGGEVNEYNLSTAWNISTASYLQNFIVTAQDSIPFGIFFKPDGLNMYIVGSSRNVLFKYDLSSAWNISTASFTYPLTDYFSIAAQETFPTGIFFKPDGLKMYVSGGSGDDVNEYNLSTAWNISTASYLQNFSVAAQDSQPTGIFFKPDGLKMYVVGDTGDDISEYNLSTAWDISTASYLQGFSIAAQELAATGIFFKPDGLKMYIVGTIGDDVNEYNLSTAWNISTASYLQNFSVSAQETAPTGIFFKPDGLKMYIVGTTGDKVNEYNLSTAWNISTASYLQNFSVAAQDPAPSSISFKPDGLKMYILGRGLDSVFSYDFV